MIELRVVVTAPGRVEVGPADEHSRAWLLAHDARMVMPMAAVREFLDGQCDRDEAVRNAARMLEAELQRHEDGRIAAGYPGPHETFRVRACRYVDRTVVTHQELVEL